MPQAMSPMRAKLMNQSAKRIRSAINKRDQAIAEIIDQYDHALEHSDEDEIESASSMLLLYCSMDPVSMELRAWAQLDAMLKRAEGVQDE